MPERNARKVIFNEVAAGYEALRPGYPERVFDEILSLSTIPDGGNMLEIGCGSGQATRSLAERGYRMTCIDISPALLEIAAAKFSDRSNVALRQVSFEEFEERENAFDLILAATSWHHIDPNIGYRKAASLLKPTGSLAVIMTLHPKPLTGFFERAQEVYRDVVPEWGSPDTSPTTAEIVHDAENRMMGPGYFEEVIPFEHRWELEYSRDRYLGLLKTYSDHYILGSDRLGKLCEKLGRIIDEEYGGKIVRPYATVGYVGKKGRAD